MDSQIEALLKVGVLTGSRAFNCSTPDSDWDIVILQSDAEALWDGDVINDTKFNSQDDLILEYHRRPYWDLSDHPEFEGEECVEYDQNTIWGPLIRILKYHSSESDEVINLFVYADVDKDILPKFTELNNLMNFLYSAEISDKSNRIDRFVELTTHLGITDF